MSGTEYTPSTALVRAAYGDVYCEGKHTVDHVCPQHADFDRWLAAHDAELTKLVRAEQRETDARIGHDAAAQWVDEWQPNSHKNSHIEDYVAAAIREASDD